MDQSLSTTPIRLSTTDRLNQYRDPNVMPFRTEGCDSPVLEKISQFNNMSGQTRHTERKSNDALKRAVLGREEAQGEMCRLRDQIAQLENIVEQTKDREQKVGQRLEAVMDSYGRAKETHSHTQTLWEKEIRRARKENFKSQSTIVKLQEELKTARTAAKINEKCLQRESERTQSREQEAFTARYQIVGVQEQLDNALERIKVVEQERDAYKTAAKNEEVARIAAEGRLPLPITDEADEMDEFAGPKKVQKKRKRASAEDCGRVSLSTMEIVSSAASEMAIEELLLQVAWERHRADRAQEMVEFLQAECRMNSCPGSKDTRRAMQSTPEQNSRAMQSTPEQNSRAMQSTPEQNSEPVESTTPGDVVDFFFQDFMRDTNTAQQGPAKEESQAEPESDTAEHIIVEDEVLVVAGVDSPSEKHTIKEESPELEMEEPENMEDAEPEAVIELPREEVAAELPEAQPGSQPDGETQDLIDFEVHELPAGPSALEEMQEEELMPMKVDESELILDEPELEGGEDEDDALALSAHSVPELEPEVVMGLGHAGGSLGESNAEWHRKSLPDAESLPESELTVVKSKKGRRSTIFFPKEGIFRTVSEQEAEAAALEQSSREDTMAGADEDDMEIFLPSAGAVEEARSSHTFARTPSVEPPSCAIMARDRTSLQSLLCAPHSEQEASLPPNIFNIPTVEDVKPMQQDIMTVEENLEEAIADDEQDYQRPESPVSTMYSSTARFKVTTTTIPVRDETSQHSGLFHEKLRTPSSASSASFDLTDPALTPTMTREQALAKIRERRGRARSMAQATAVPPKALVPTTAKRDISSSSTKVTVSKTTPKTISKTMTRTRSAAKPATSRDTSRAASRATSGTASRAASRATSGTASRAASRDMNKDMSRVTSRSTSRTGAISRAR